MVGCSICNRRLLVGQELLVLRDALGLKRCHDLGHKARKFALCLDRMFAPDDLIADKSEVVTDEHRGTECDADGKRFVTAVPQANRVRLVAIRSPTDAASLKAARPRGGSDLSNT